MSLQTLAMLSPIEAQAVFGLAWLSFGAGHSLLAHGWAKRRLGALLGPYYRLAYNLLATAHIAAVWALGQAVLGGAPDFSLPAFARGAMSAISIIGFLILLSALREYDLGLFSGLAQIRGARRGTAPSEDEPLITGGLHRYVRHPLYLGAYILLWGRAVDPFGLMTALWGTVYLTIGTGFEERKLVALYGRAYEDYRDRVPALIPRLRRP